MENSIRGLRPGSLFWPLVLIAAGVLWLLTNFGVIPASNFFILVRLWPVLLIMAGLDLLVGRRWPIVSALIALVTVGLGVAAVIFAPRLGLAAGPGRWHLPVMVFGGESGSGNVITETREIEGVDAVSFGSFGDLDIVIGDEESLVIEAEDNVLENIRTEVSGGRLIIDDENGFGRGVTPTEPVRFTLTVRSLRELDHSGAGNVTASGITAETFSVSMSGAGSIDLEDLEAEHLEFSLSGAGNMTASGQVDSQDIAVSGVGNLEAGDLQSQTAEVAVSGAGNAEVWVEQSLDVDISGAGSVRYRGEPDVSSDISGLGSVEQVE